ncbi:MAG: M48 family metalloprotease, partial [Magnetococcales bacterium]|nr:M48 family metalloprotease [Magnetococcales bacterium]
MNRTLPPPRQPRRRLQLAVGALALILGACATPSPPEKKEKFWRAEQVATTQQAEVVLENSKTNRPAHLKREWLQRIVVIKKRIEEAAGISTQFLFSEGDFPNAFAWIDQENQNMVSFNLPMLEFLQGDEHSFAFVYGHEVGHNVKRHTITRNQLGAGVFVLKELAGFGLSALGIPLGGLISDTGFNLVTRKFDRDQEREADDLGVEYMVKAGFDPTGAVRFQEKLTTSTGSGWLNFLSTHPSGEERIARLKFLAAQYQAGAPRPPRSPPPPPPPPPPRPPG